MKKSWLYALTVVLFGTMLAGCSGVTALLKSGKPEDIYAKAMELYDIGKWQKASTLFESVHHYYVGTPREASLSFFTARCKYMHRANEPASMLL